jgi:hypothetical protein
VVPEGAAEIKRGERMRVVLLDDFGMGVGGPAFLPE